MLSYLIGSIKQIHSQWTPKSGDKIRFVTGWYANWTGRISTPGKKPGEFIIQLDKGGHVNAFIFELELYSHDGPS